ncbi:hypothetical protein RBU07_34285, partial [Pseudomonas aeruginosa]|nr:hypothetical protein [Pseudomonas aeruginosa]
MNAADPLYMARALELARQGLYSTHPNPRVGCVLVKDGQVVGVRAFSRFTRLPTFRCWK